MKRFLTGIISIITVLALLTGCEGNTEVALIDNRPDHYSNFTADEVLFAIDYEVPEEVSEMSEPLYNADYEVSLSIANPTDSVYKFTLAVEDRERLQSISVAPGKIVTKSFPVSITDGSMDFLFTDISKEKNPMKVYIASYSLTRKATEAPGEKPTIYLASDSTVQTYSSSFEPQTGWGECLADYFSENVSDSASSTASDSHYRVYETDKVVVENRAIGGRSSRSFIEQGRLEEILSVIRPGDYLFLQWGHNDATKNKAERYVPVEDFSKWLSQYVDGAIQRGATPVLITPVVRYSWSSDAYTGGFKTFNSSFEAYRKVMIEYAKDANVALIDLTGRSIDYANTLGAEGAKSLFLMVEAGVYPDSKYADGVDDHTHLQYAGAKAFAGCVADGIKAVGGADGASLYENEVYSEELKTLAELVK